MERKARAAGLSGLYLLVIAAVLVLVNMVAFRMNHRADLTKNERYTLSAGSARLVGQGLKEQLQLTLYVTRGLAKQDLFVEDLTNLLGEYEDASAGKLRYVVIEPKTDEERDKAREAGLQEAAFGEGSETGDQAKIARGFMGLVFEYGAEKEVIPLLHPDQSQGLEFWITNKIREIRDKADDVYQTVGVIVKDGIKLADANLVPPQGGRPGPNIKAILQQALPFYKIEDVDLQDGAAAIDKELRGVIVLQADKDWNAKELARIDEFVMQGDKALLVVAGAVNMKSADKTMKAELSTRGLEKLLDGYGIEMKKEAVLDWGSSMRIPVQNSMGRLSWFLVPGVLQLQYDSRFEPEEQILDNSFAGFFRLEELAFPFPSTLVPHPEKQAAAKMKVVARSTPRTTVDGSDQIDMSLREDWQPTGEYGQRAIAVALEGKLSAAFAKDKRPEGISDYPTETTADSRILVIGAGQFLANPFARAGNPPPMPPQMAMMGAMGGDRDLQQLAVPYAQKYLTSTILAFKNLLDWMANDKDLIAVSAKLIGDPNLTYSDVAKPEIDLTKDDPEAIKKKQEEYRLERQHVQNKVQWSLTFVPALLFAAFGMVRWRRREQNRGNIKLS